MSRRALCLIGLTLAGFFGIAGSAYAIGLPLDSPSSPSLQTTSAEEELAVRYAPIVYLKEQDEECDSHGEAYAPVEVEAVLDNPAVRLMQSTAGGDEVVVEGPAASDLYQKGEGYYLDYPGDPRQPGCGYERDFRELQSDHANVAYASIRKEPGHAGIALQYWFFFYFNDWNNTHEADWEMIQIIFDANTAEEALQQEPVRVGYSQHEAGERGDWNDDKVQKEDGRPVVYTASGGHPSQFDDAVYFGLGEDGAGFGCDDASSPSVRVPLEARLMPDEVSGPDDPYAWITYGGQWGQKDASFWNGPTGPTVKSKFKEPFTWQEDLHDSAVKVPGGTTLAPNAIHVFCGTISFGSRVLNAYTRAPLAVVGSGGLIFALALGVVYLGRTTSLRGARPLAPGASESTPLHRERDLWQIMRAAGRIYRHHWPALLLIGAFYVPIGWTTSIIHSAVTNNPPFEPLWRLVNDYPATKLIITLLLGGAQAAIGAIIVTAAVVVVLRDLDAEGEGDAFKAYREVIDKLGTLIGAYLRSSVRVVLLALTVIGIPWAIQRIVRWYFLGQTVMLEQKSGREALSASADVVERSWWRSFGITFLLGTVGAVTGPVIAIFFLLFVGVSVTFANMVSTAIYIVLIPYVATAVTLLYCDLKVRRGL